MNYLNRALIVFGILCNFLLSGCTTEPERQSASEIFEALTDTIVVTKPVYAEGFRLFQKGEITKLKIYNPSIKNQNIKTVFLANAKTAKKYNYPTDLIITPVDSIAVFSGTQLNALKAFGLLSKVVGVSEADYILEPEVRKRIASGHVVELAGNGNFYVEKTLEVSPYLIFHSPYYVNETNPLAETKIPMIPFFDFMETNPLGRAEWLKFTALFFEKEKEADILFQSIVEEYNSFRQLTEAVQNKPTVFSDKYFSGFWYVPGGQSYVAALFRDAGADYLWKNTHHTASFPLDFEVMFDRAYNAEYWRIVGSFGDKGTYEDLIAENALYAQFSAVKNKKVIWCDAEKTAYFEKSALEPHYVLADLIKAFHPQLLPDYKPKYYNIIP